MKKLFIDTNVMAHFIILTNLKRIHDEDNIWKKYKRYLASYEFIQNLANRKLKNYRCYTSTLALAELVNAICNEYFCQRMYNDGVPFSSWKYKVRKKVLKPDDVDEIEKSIIEFENNIISDRRRLSKIKLYSDIYDFDIITELIVRENLLTQDSILLSTAINKQIDFFITKDKPLRKEQINDIKIVAPEHFNHEVNRSHKSAN